MNQHIDIPFDIEMLPVTRLQAGSLSCLYENGNLRRIELGGIELLRMIYGAVRDENWVTLPYNTSLENIEIGENSFRISYRADYIHRGQQVYSAEFLLEGKADNSISVEMKGRALESFTRNRIGLCVLHPRESKGIPVEVTGPDGAIVNAGFPVTISPHQVLLDISALKYSIGPIDLSLAFEGDVFETEDQRNWMDASYKTYSTPLAIPFPVEVNPGDTVFNRVTLAVGGSILSAGARKSVDTARKKFAFPAIGYEKNYSAPLSEGALEKLKTVVFDHYRVEADLDDPDWEARLNEAVKEAHKFRTKLEFVVFFNRDDGSVIRDVIKALKPIHEEVSHVLPLMKGRKATPVGLQENFYPLMKQAFPDILVGYGTDAYFTELNRERPQQDFFDFVSFPLHPQAHAQDTRTIIENLETGPDIIATIRSFTGKPIFVSPLTFSRRKNPDATNPQSATESVVDERQHSWFCVGWTLWCICSLCGADRITMYRTTGAKGILPDPGQTAYLLETLARIKEFSPVRMSGQKNSPTGPSIILEDSRGDTLSINLAEGFSL